MKWLDKLFKTEKYHQNTFNNLFINEGGIYDYKNDNAREFFEHVFKSFKITLALHRQKNNNFPLPKLYVINSTTINAGVTKKNGTYYIGVNIGTILLIRNLFYRIMSSPNVLKKYGNALIENINKVNSKDLIRIYENTGELKTVFPKDQTRAIIADYMINITLTYLLRHEFGHIVNGHLDYCQKAKGLFNIAEKDKPSDDPRFSQTLEMDADSYATNEAIFDILKFSGKSIESMPKELEVFIDRKEHLFLHIFCIYASFRLLSSPLNNINKAKTYTHPPAVIRQALILSNIATIFEKENYGITMSEAADICLKATQNVESAFANISTSTLEYDTITSAFTKPAVTYTRNIFYNWQNVRPVLEKYAFDRLPDYDPH